MATITAPLNAKDAYITLNGTDISGSANYVEITPSREIGTFNVFSDDWDQALGGKRKWVGKIRVAYSEVTSEGADMVFKAFDSNTAQALVVAPKGNTVSNWKWSGNILISSTPLKLDSGDPKVILIEAPFTGHGTLTKGTVS